MKYEEVPRDRLVVAIGVVAEVIAWVITAYAVSFSLPLHQPFEAITQFIISMVTIFIVFIPLHELLHAVVAWLLGSRVSIRFLRRYLAITTLFLDPLPLWKFALVYMAPVLGTYLATILTTQLLQLLRFISPSCFCIALLWLAMSASDATSLLQLWVKKPRAVACTLDGSLKILR